jgi:hypothetical protein
MSYRDQFSRGEWLVLESAPLFVFYIVAGIDKNIDKKEVAEFVEQVVAAPKHSHAFGREVFLGLQQDLQALLDVTGKADWVEGLKAVRGLLSRVPSDEAEDFKASLLLIANEVSKSSGGLFQDKVSADEKKAMVFIVAILEGQI